MPCYFAGAGRDSSFAVALSSYRAQAWDDAASALSDYADYTRAGDLRNGQSVEMMAKAFLNAGVSNYTKHLWFSASLSFEKLLENSAWNHGPNSSTAKSAVWRDFHTYVRTVPGLHEQASLYWARATHLAAAEHTPRETAVIDVISNESRAAPARVPPEGGYTVHVFNSTGDIDLVVSGRNLQQALASVDSSAANGQAIFSVVLTSAAKSAMMGPLEIEPLVPGKVVWHADSIREAAENLQALKESHPKIDDFSVAMLLPKNEDQKQKFGLHDWSTEDQQKTWESAQSFLDQSGIRDVITEKVNRGGIRGWRYDVSGASET